MNSKALFKGLVTIIVAVSAGLFLSCELSQDMNTTTTTTAAATVLVNISSPTNGGTAATNLTVTGSAFASEGVLQVVVYAAPTNGGMTNSSTSLMASVVMGAFHNRLHLAKGYYYLWAKAFDTKGQSATCARILICADTAGPVDTTPPVIALTSHTNHQPVGSSYTLSGTVSDSGGSGLAGVYVKQNAGSWQAASVNGGIWSSTLSASATGYYTNFYYALDNSANTSATQKVVVYYEVGNVSVTISHPVSGIVTNVTSVAVSGTSAVDGASITNLALCNNGGSYSSAGISGTASWSGTMALTEGSNVIRARAMADNGRSSESSEVTVVCDTVRPSASITSPVPGRVYTNTASISVAGTASDATSGVSKVYVIVNGGTPDLATGTASWTYPLSLAAGSYTVKAYAVDAAGNVGLTNSVSFSETNIDSTRPTVSITSPTTGATVTSAALTVSGTASDNVAVSTVFVKLNSGSFTAATGTTDWSQDVTLTSGANTVYAYSVDGSGNHSTTNSISVTYTPTLADGIFQIIFKNWSSPATLYLVGDMNSWNSTGITLSTSSMPSTNNVTNAVLTANIDQGSSTADLEFKILNTSGTWETAWGFSSWTLSGVTLKSGDSQQVMISCDNNDVVKVIFDVTANTITATVDARP